MSRDFYTQHLFNHAYDVVELLAAELTCQVTGAVVGFQRDAVIASQLTEHVGQGGVVEAEVGHVRLLVVSAMAV